LWTPAAYTYRRKMKISDADVQQAVVIMAMAKADAAGIGFTCDPLTGRQDTLVIHANFGLGNTVVNGSINPDEYRLTFENLIPSVTHKKIGAKQGLCIPKLSGRTEFVFDSQNGARQALTDENILRLGLLIQRVFEALGHGEEPQDVEWVYDGKDFILVQARPVTSVPKYTYPKLKGQPEIWSNANIRDALPMVLSTLGQRLIKIMADPILRSTFKAINYPSLPGLKYTRVYRGRGYFNLSAIQWEYFDALGITPKETNEAIGGHQPEIQIGTEKKNTLRKSWRMIKLLLAIKKAMADGKDIFQANRELVSNWLSLDFKSLSNQEKLLLFQEFWRRGDSYASVPGLLNSAAAALFTFLSKTLDGIFPGQGITKANALLLGRGDITSAEQGYRLLRLADIATGDADTQIFLKSDPLNYPSWENKLPEQSPFKQGFRAFLDEFGHRAVYEGDIINPRWNEDPSYLLDLIASMMDTDNYHEIREKQRTKNQEAWQEIKQSTSFLRQKLISWLAAQSIKGSEMREMAKSELARLACPIRLLALEIGKDLAEKNVLREAQDVFHCSWPDLVSILAGYWDGQGLPVLVEDRKQTRLEWENIKPPDTIIDEIPQSLAPITFSAKEENLLGVGIGVSVGRASGRARVITHPKQGSQLNLGEVLVAPSTDPGWVPLFLKAAALIMETGGHLSHGAIVAREYGIPAVVNVPGVMELIHDGTTVIVDGDAGKVFLSEPN